MDLEIEFVDGQLDLNVGNTERIRVVEAGTGKIMSLGGVRFEFEPAEWGHVEATDDPEIGVLHVDRVVEHDDPLLAPAHTITASLQARARRTFKSQQQVRIVPAAFELELAFEVHKHGRTVRFSPKDLTQPMDWSKARTGDPETQSIFLRDDRPILRVSPVESFPVEIEITFPNGEIASLELNGDLYGKAAAASEGMLNSGVQARLDGKEAPASAPAPAEQPAAEPDERAAEEAQRTAQEQAAQEQAAQEQAAQEQAAQEQAAQAQAAQEQAAQRAAQHAAQHAAQQAAQQAAARQQAAHQEAQARQEAARTAAVQQAQEGETLREALNRLHRYINSFSSAQRAKMSPDQAGSIRDRMQREVDQVRERIEVYRGEDRDELLQILAAVSEGLASWAPSAAS